jgi:hypothetical protein
MASSDSQVMLKPGTLIPVPMRYRKSILIDVLVVTVEATFDD